MHRQELMNELQRELSGYVLQAGEEGYQQAIEIDNGRIQSHPTFVIMANAVKDVSVALRFAQKNGLRMTVKGGGHSANGYSLNTGGVVLDLNLMNAISLNEKKRSVTVQMGARWRDVYVFLMQSGTGLIPIGGGCPTVGIPGFMQGGGYSFVSRSYGMSVDNLLSLTIVTVDGEVRRISEDSHSKEERDLFWACRGGGGGNFGVVVEMELQVHMPNTAKMLMGQIRWPIERAQEVLSFYNQWVETLPNEQAAYGIWGTEPDPVDPSRTIRTFGFTTIYNGEIAAGMELLQPLLMLEPLYAKLNTLTLPEFELLNGATTLVNRRSAYIRAGIMPPLALTPAAIDVMLHYMTHAPSASSFMVWTHGGGKISEVTPEETAFVHRAGRFIPELKAIWDTPQQARANIEWAFNFFRDLEPHFSGAYVNYIDPLLGNWADKYYGVNYPRLLDIKRTWDPDNFFRFQQSVGSAFEPSHGEPLDLSPLNRTFVD